MPGTTTKGFRYPVNADAPNVAVDIQHLADDVDVYLNNYVTATSTSTLTNKTLVSPVIATIVNTGTLTLPTATDTLVGRATSDTLTNKTLTSPTISGLQISDSSIVFEGATADAWETTLTVADPTNDRTLTLPNETGTLATEATALDIARANAFMLGGM